MACFCPKIIVNPSYINSTFKYPYLSGFSRSYYISPDKSHFDFKYFHPNVQGVTHDNISQFVAYDSNTGDCINVYLEVPCGHCDGCRLSKRSNLKYRMILEQYGRSTPMFFVTLTYNDDYLPADGVSVDDCQKFFKRFRERLHELYHYDAPFRYILFSEYGKKRYRPHYHFILFGFDHFSVGMRFLDFQAFLAEKCWKNGFVRVDQCNAGAFDYVSKYVWKKENVPPHKNSNFVLSSRRGGGIGVNALSSPVVLDQLLRSPTGSVTLQLYGKQFTFSVPKQIYSYLYKNNVQSLRRKYLGTVRALFGVLGALSYYSRAFSRGLVRDRDRKGYERWSTICNICSTVGDDGILLSDPHNIVQIAPYAPEFEFYNCDIPSLKFIESNFDWYCDKFYEYYSFLKTFDPQFFQIYLENTECIRKFAAEVVSRIPLIEDLNDLAVVSISKFIRDSLDLCRDNQ